MKKEIENFISDFIISHNSKFATKWMEPLVAFADTNDPLFVKLKEVVRETHSLPTDLLKETKTVVSYFIPFSRNRNWQCQG